MTDYNLAKKLLKAGFPNLEFYDGAFNRYPALEELIEACGDEFFCIKRGMDAETEKFSKDWYAVAYKKGMNKTMGLGNSPTEAVAHLWLVITSKKEK